MSTMTEHVLDSPANPESGDSPAGGRRSMLEFLWSDWRIATLAAIAVAAVAGLAFASWTPRGAVTSSEALLSMGTALAVGVIAGLLTGSRWSMLLAPAAFAVAFELGRLGATGPTVDGFHLGSVYGVIAVVVGRLFLALLVVAPMALGALYGVWISHRMGRMATTPPGIPGWIVMGVLTVGLAGLAVTVARPGSTAPIVGDDGEPLPGSIAELTNVTIGGHDQALMVRGTSVDNPVLLHLAGGPGGADLGAMRDDVGLEQHFVVVTWDQRGTGKSYAALDPVETLTVDQMVDDTIEVTNYLRQRFDEEKIYMVGNSWGTFLGVLAAEQRPDLYHAYVGTGQMVSAPETDLMFYEDALTWAERTGDAGLSATLRRTGPPPYENLLDYEPSVGREHDWNPYSELDTNKEMPFNAFVSENSLMDRVNAMRGLLDTFAVLYPQLQDVDLRAQAPRLEIPVYLVIGAHEARGRAVLADEWFDMLEAPSKSLTVFEHSGHRPSFEEPAEFVSVMTEVRDATYSGR